MRLRRRRWGVLLFLAVPAWPQSPPLPVGNQFQVNAYTPSFQSLPSIASDAGGKFVVTWQSFGSGGNDSSYYSVQGQRYTAGGAWLGGQFQVNAYTADSQSVPSVASAADGDFVVIWQSNGSGGGDTSYNSIQGQRYAAGGAPVGGQFQVNTYTTSYQALPSVASDAEGAFVVVWQSDGSDGGDISYKSIQGQRYAAGGAPVGGEFQVNAYTTDSQTFPSVASDAEGNFVVVWVSGGSDGSDTLSDSIQGQRFAAGGAQLGGQFQVNTFAKGYQARPSVASDAGGNFVAVWQSAISGGSDTSLSSIHGQRYTAGGAPIGGQFQVNSFTIGYQIEPSVASDAEGDFVVVWSSQGSDGGDTSLSSIQGQRYSAGGAPLGGQFQVNAYTSSSQGSPSVASDAEGDFVVVWSSQGSYQSDISYLSVQGQRFRVTGDLRGRVFFDQDFDGIQDGGEPGIVGIAVELYDDALTLRRTVVTDNLGEYHLRPKEGSWVLRFVAPPAWFTIANVGGDDTVDSDAAPATGETAPFNVSINLLDTTIDAGLVVVPPFVDGFETGNTTRWSATVP
jgi:hypothetical protein